MFDQQNYERSKVWKLSMRMLERVYRQTRLFPPEEKSVMGMTLRKAAATISSSIAEAIQTPDPEGAKGCYRAAFKALRDLDTHLVLCKRLHLIRPWEQRSMRKRYRLIDRLLQEEIQPDIAEDDEVILAEAA